MQADANAAVDGSNLKVVLVDLADYTYSAAHDSLDDIPAGARVSTGSIANPTVTNGLLDGDDTTLSAVTGDQSEALVIYTEGGSEPTSLLVAFYDTGITGFPITPSGSDIILVWDASGIFQL